jgi:thiol:disulfide interchange protein
MKPLILFAASFIAVSAAIAGDGVDFRTGDFDRVFRQAGEERKLMLLDFTASWCVPCKKMDREVFPDKALGKLVNEVFIPFKVDADYFWGMDIAKKYGVKAFPTILIVDNKGKEVKRIVGYRTADKLIDELQPLSEFQNVFGPE